MIDGFKRLHAFPELGLPRLRVTGWKLASREFNATLVELNGKSTPLRPLQEALVVQKTRRISVVAT